MNSIFPYILTMAAVTFAVRALPLLLLRKEIQNPFIRSFLYYVPFVTLSVMVFPAVLHSTSSMVSAALGTVAASLLALYGGNLIQVAMLACATVFIAELML